MPYYHNDCGGLIKWYPFLPVRPKCTKCGQTWSPTVVYQTKPEDMTYIWEGLTLDIPRGETSYAAWADKAPPGVAVVASNLPNWPRKWRLVSFLGSITFLSGAFFGLYLLNFWAVIGGAVVFAASPIIIIALLSRRRGLGGVTHGDEGAEAHTNDGEGST